MKTFDAKGHVVDHATLVESHPPTPFSDHSGSIAAGGVAQNVYGAEAAPEHGVEFYNTSDTLMYLNFGADATAGNGVPVAAGAGYYLPGPGGRMASGRLSVLCASASKTFTCKTF